MTIRRMDKPPTETELIRSLGVNTVSRNEDVKRFLKTLDEVEGPFSIFLDSRWGDGKTFFVKQVELILRLRNERIERCFEDGTVAAWKELEDGFPVDELFLPVYFNAWENDDFSDPLLPLLATIAAGCSFVDAKGERNVPQVVSGAIEVLGGLAGVALEACGLLSGASAVAEGAAKLSEAAFRENLLEQYEKRTELRERFDLMADASLKEVANKMVIFIDELDRCRPAFAVKLLEQTKALFARGNVTLVCSTDMAQLSHAICGLYGASFDAGKYLERFYDMRIDLTPVDSIAYLKYLGFDSGDAHNYTLVANGFLRQMQPTMRDTHRIVDALKRGQRYILSRNRDGDIVSELISISEGVLLPTLIVMSYDDPQSWQDVLGGRDFGCVYEYGKANRAFVETIDEVLSRQGNRLEKRGFTSANRAQLIEQICALAFLDDYMDPRLKEASDNLGGRIPGGMDREVLRLLAAGC